MFYFIAEHVLLREQLLKDTINEGAMVIPGNAHHEELVRSVLDVNL